MNASIKPKLTQEYLTQSEIYTSDYSVNTKVRQHTSAPRTADSEKSRRRTVSRISEQHSAKYAVLKNSWHLKEVNTLGQYNY